MADRREDHHAALAAIRQAMQADFKDPVTYTEGRDRHEVVLWDPSPRLEQLDAHLATVGMVIDHLFEERDRAQAEVK